MSVAGAGLSEMGGGGGGGGKQMGSWVYFDKYPKCFNLLMPMSSSEIVAMTLRI